jgi:hypothetical protein
MSEEEEKKREEGNKNQKKRSESAGPGRAIPSNPREKVVKRRRVKWTHHSSFGKSMTQTSRAVSEAQLTMLHGRRDPQ